MNIKYRLVALFTAVVMLLSVCLAAVAEDVDGNITKKEYDQNLGAALEGFYQLLMGAETYEEFTQLTSQMTQEQLNTIAALFGDAYNENLNAKFADLIAAMTPVQEDTAVEEEPFVSEILYVTVPYTRVADFKAPVVGTSTSKARMMPASSASYALTPRETSTDDDNGLVLNKTVAQNANGKYTLTLEAYATGSKVITETKKDVPTDIVLVLDQSGSMAENMKKYAFQAYSNKTNSNYYDLRHNGGDANLYYQLSDGGYASVSVMETVQISDDDVTAIQNGYNNARSDWRGYVNYYDSSNKNILYAKVNGVYQKVTVTHSGNRYVYTLPDGTPIASERGDYGTPSFSGVDGNILYLANPDTNNNIYTYQYTDEKGVLQTIGTSTGANTRPTEFTLYEKYQTGTTTRLAALKSAVTTFTDSVYAKAAGPDGLHGNEDDVDHRIAVVGFATGDYSNNSDYPKYENTEVFVGSNQYNYNVNASQHYGEALQDMTSDAGYNNVLASKNALAARGATYPNYGLKMAQGIFDANPVPENEKRNRVVIMFTDGQPGYSGYDSDVASSAISQASTLKSAGATVYTVGIFEGADATSAGDSDGDPTQKANWFMQKVSSNNGIKQTPSYYLSAADAGDLNSIFKQIANNIESGGSSSTLDETAVVRDIIAPSFTLPEGANKDDIKLYTANYTGQNQWGAKTSADATATVDGDRVDVTGFNFSENWVGTVNNNGVTEYRGSKLIIEIPIEVKSGFLGGNNVPTNGAGSGVYSGGTCIETFTSPTVNVPIAPITVTAPDKNVYLLGGVTQDQMKAGATITSGTVPLYPTQKNFGLQDWQYAYVNIGIITSDAKTNLTADTTYEVTCTISPSESAATDSVGDAAESKTGKKQGNVYVFKPEMTFADSVVEYLSTHSFPAYFEDTGKGNNYRGLVWKHGDTLSTAEGVTMTGDEPTLAKVYSYAATDIENNSKIIATADIPVNVTVKIGTTDVTNHVTFVHLCDCALDHECGWNQESGAEFLLHVTNIVADLTITKTGLDEYAYGGDVDREMAIFTVKVTTKRGEETYTIALADDKSATIKDVLVGTGYTITEQNGWTWRYGSSDVVKSNDTIVVGGTSVTITNNATNPYWLGGDNYAVNVFGTGTTSSGAND